MKRAPPERERLEDDGSRRDRVERRRATGRAAARDRLRRSAARRRRSSGFISASVTRIGGNWTVRTPRGTRPPSGTSSRHQMNVAPGVGERLGNDSRAHQVPDPQQVLDVEKDRGHGRALGRATCSAGAARCGPAPAAADQSPVARTFVNVDPPAKSRDEIGDQRKAVEHLLGAALARQRLQGEAAQRARHDRRVVDAFRIEHPDEPHGRGTPRAQQLLAPRLDARDQDRALVEREDLAERVVAGHRDDADRAGPSAPRCARRRSRPPFSPIRLARSRNWRCIAAGMNGPSTTTAPIGMSGIVLVGRQHPVDRPPFRRRRRPPSPAHRARRRRGPSALRSDCGSARRRYPV